MHRQVLNNTSVGRLVTGHSVNTSSIKGGRFTVPLSGDHVFIWRKLCDMIPRGENIKHLPQRVKFTHTHTHTQYVSCWICQANILLLYKVWMCFLIAKAFKQHPQTLQSIKLFRLWFACQKSLKCSQTKCNYSL